MKDQIISFETAKLAKNIGFTRELLDYTISSVRKPYYNHLGEYNGDVTKRISYLLEENRDFDIDDVYPLYAAAPQSLLQKWIRENYLIHIVINSSFGYIICRLNDISGGKTKDKCIPSDVLYDSYEDALENALQHIIKYIIN